MSLCAGCVSSLDTDDDVHRVLTAAPRLRWKELHLPGELDPRHILQEQLESVLGMEALCSQQCEYLTGVCPPLSGSLPLCSWCTAVIVCLPPLGSQDEEDDQLQASVQDLLRAAAMAGLDVLSQPLRHLVDRARKLGSCLPALVPGGLYLPAPPLYCPQPAPDPDVCAAVRKRDSNSVTVWLDGLGSAPWSGTASVCPLLVRSRTPQEMAHWRWSGCPGCKCLLSCRGRCYS